MLANNDLRIVYILMFYCSCNQRGNAQDMAEPEFEIGMTK